MWAAGLECGVLRNDWLRLFSKTRPQHYQPWIHDQSIPAIATAYAFPTSTIMGQLTVDKLMAVNA